MFDKLIQVLVFGCGYRRIADRTCSATTLRRRRDEWISAGVAEQLCLAVVAAYDRMLGLRLEHLAVDGCIRDHRLLGATLDAIGAVGPRPAQPVVHLDAGYDYQPCRQVPAARGMGGRIAARGRPAPIQADRHWVIERTHAWGNQYGKLRW